MKKIILLSTLSAALLASFGAHAADTTELKVKGVIRPAACSPSIAGGGVVDYGTIAAKSLPAGEFKNLGIREVNFIINCDGPAKIALKTLDNRSSSTVAGISKAVGTAVPNASGGWDDSYLFGLGTVANKNVGSYVVAFKQGAFSADDKQVDTIRSEDNKATWRRPTAGAPRPGEYIAWAPTGTTVPTAYSKISGTLLIDALINKPEDLPLAQDVPLDGSATLEVNYL